MNENTTPKSVQIKPVSDNRLNETTNEKPEPKPHTPEMPTWFLPDYPPLKSADDVGKATVNGQVFYYPQVVRTMVDPPVIGQQFCLISFNLFKEPRTFRGKPIYGFVKFRGANPDPDSARFASYKIVREVDSKFFIGIGATGTWLPITECTSVVNEIYDVKEYDEQKQLRTEAIKEKEAEQRKIANEIKEAEEALRTGGDIYDRPESLDFYTMKRNTEMRLVETIEASERKVREYYNSLIETHMILRLIENEHPDYANEWLDCHNQARAKVSLPAFIPGEKTFDRYNKCDLKEMVTEYPEIFEKVKKNMKTYGNDGKDIPKGSYDALMKSTQEMNKKGNSTK